MNMAIFTVTVIVSHIHSHGHTYCLGTKTGAVIATVMVIVIATAIAIVIVTAVLVDLVCFSREVPCPLRVSAWSWAYMLEHGWRCRG